jgi:putative peptidoglycan lipid II flippase
VVGVVAVAVVALDLTGGGGSTDSPSRGGTSPHAQASRPVPIAKVTDFDPQGDPPSENPELAPLAADGRVSTAWHTSTYYDPLRRLKSGVGLLVDLGKPSRVGDVRLRLQGSPTSLQLLAAPGDRTAPSSTRGLETVASRKDAGASADLRLAKPMSTRWLVVWLTSLPRGPAGWVGSVAEISVRS